MDWCPNMKHRIKFMQGSGHQIFDGKGKHHSTYDDKDEAEAALEKLNEPSGKEHQQEHWDKK